MLQAVDGDKCVGAIVCKLDRHKGCTRRGYIAMLAVDHQYRRLGIGLFEIFLSYLLHNVLFVLSPLVIFFRYSFSARGNAHT